MTMRARLAAAVAGGALAILPAAPALADGQPVEIQGDHVPTTAADFRPQQCDGPLAGLADGQDGWHFVLPDGPEAAFTSLTLTFDTPGGSVPAVITSTDAGAPSAAGGWSGFLDGKHAWVVTDAGWTLTAAEATISGSKKEFFNLSHTCADGSDNGGGKPTPGPTPVPTPTEPGNGNGNGNGNGQGGGNGGDDDDSEAGLPVTGMQVGGLAAVGAGLLAAGAVALLAVRRRRSLPAELTEG